ncbi:MAG: hypothetical protein DMF90_11495 [Acidobacteria bacterium]|nr:MAG: hypothetical protein DMF90_11495 [Acidobacteriota bacterium]
MKGIPRSRRFVAVLCVAIVVCALLWMVAPALVILLLGRSTIAGDWQFLSLLSIGATRAPPARLF